MTQESQTREATPSPMTESPTESQVVRPDWLPEGFENPQQLAEAYNSLQSNQLMPVQ